MVNGIVILFLVLATLFTLVHTMALAASLYWYHWWFDVLMHFWGGLLVGLGVHTFATFRWLHLEPTTRLVLLALLIATGCWEIFEWFAGLYDQHMYVADTIQDLLLGFSGGLLIHAILKTYKIK
ncbi:MAG: hypothetical protein KBC35_04720 [Candidatus Pacebacteria bacterium]|nr:hypothetical protein [Candidatus Paceibacterota bacterium]